VTTQRSLLISYVDINRAHDVACCLSVCLSQSLSICLSVCLTVCLSVCLCVLQLGGCVSWRSQVFAAVAHYSAVLGSVTWSMHER